MNDLSKLEELEILSNKIIDDVVNISLNKELDILQWSVGIFPNFNFDINSVANRSLFLIYKIDNHIDCLNIFNIIINQLKTIRKLNLSDDEIRLNRNQYIIFWRNQVLNID